MKKLNLNKIRSAYLDFFKNKGHLVLKSYSLIPENDDSLLLINAGMAPLKDYFTGTKKMAKNRATLFLPFQSSLSKTYLTNLPYIIHESVSLSKLFWRYITHSARTRHEKPTKRTRGNVA